MKEIKQIVWKHVCESCGEKNKLQTNFSKREPEDKATIKTINTAYYCLKCDGFNSVDLSKEKHKELTEVELYDWQPGTTGG